MNRHAKDPELQRVASDPVRIMIRDHYDRARSDINELIRHGAWQEIRQLVLSMDAALYAKTGKGLEDTLTILKKEWLK